MKRWLIIFLLFGIANITYSQQKEAGDENIVLPSVVLEIEDLSVEKVDAGLPEESDISAPERELFIPEEVILDIKEPKFDIGLEDLNREPLDLLPMGSGTGGFPLIAEAMLGAGNAGTIVSKISFYKPGELPRFKFLFNHELIDGYSYHPSGMESYTIYPAGIGFNKREDTLLASVMLKVWKGELESLVNFTDKERGLQGQGAYFSAVNRFINNKNTLIYPFNSTFTLSGSLGVDATSLILTGAETPVYAVSYPPTEIILYPEIKGDFSFRSVDLGISALYKYRTLKGNASYDDHRLLVLSDLKIEFPFWLSMTGHVGYFRNNRIPYLVPFEIAMGGSPSNLFSFGLRGGYFVEENNLLNLLDQMDYLDLPAELNDNHGWFGDGELNFNLSDNRFLISLSTLLKYNRLLYDYGAAPSASGLIGSVVYNDLFSLALEGGVKWNIVEGISLNLHNDTRILFTDTASTLSRYSLEGDFSGSKSPFSGKILVALDTDYSSLLELPVLNIGGYYTTTENLSLALEMEDLLQPFLSRDRIAVAPFITPGIKAIFKIKINF